MANEQNLTAPPIRTTEEAVKRGRAGGIASGKERRRRKAVADALRAALDRKAKDGTDRTMLDEITEKAIDSLAGKPSMQDLRILADTLGELTQNIHQDVDMEITCKFGDE